MFPLFLLTAVFYNIFLVDCGSVLFIPPLVSASHKIAMAKWADALAEREHEVYWWAPAVKRDKYQPKNVTYVDHFTVAVDDKFLMDAFYYENVSEIYSAVWKDNYQSPFLEALFTYQLVPFCEAVAKNHKTSLNKILSRSYDFIIMDELFNACGYVVSQILGSPMGIYVSTCRRSNIATRFNYVPVRPAYTAPMSDMLILSDQMTLWQRVHSTLSWWLGDIGSEVVFKLMSRKLKQTFPQVEDVTQSMVSPDFQFLCTHQQLELTEPLPHNLIYIGGLQLSDVVPPLSQEWEDFVNAPKKGFIVFAMGHWTKWKFAPPEWIQSFVAAFKRIPRDYSIIWQYDEEPMKDLPKNIKQSKWLPQRSLLANPNCVLFITHGGCNGLTEALHHAVPMVAIPLFADQPDGAARVGKRGFGVVLRKENISADSLYHSIMTVLKNESYGINVRKFADNLKSDPMSALEKAVFWTEFALRHRGGAQYKPTIKPSLFAWIKYYCVDVVFYVCVIIFVILWSITKIVGFLCRCVFGANESVKAKTE